MPRTRKPQAGHSTRIALTVLDVPTTPVEQARAVQESRARHTLNLMRVTDEPWTRTNQRVTRPLVRVPRNRYQQAVAIQESRERAAAASAALNSIMDRLMLQFEMVEE